jgi:Asp-tRNA(Asn)/Glu-tRNA(Gln) amidotransferase A subunit family amidase
MTGDSPLWNPWSLRVLLTDLRSGRQRPEGAISEAGARIAATDSRIRAWVEQLSPMSSRQVGVLGGVPLGVKDIIDVAGSPTRCGSTLRGSALPASSDAEIVTAWRAAGAVPVGKTVTTEFAFFAPGPTRNPAAPEHTPGGSSSGSAAAVAAGHVPLAIGTQTAGSTTRPAAYCGVASLTLSHGRYSQRGVTGLSPSLDSHGLFAATTSDLAVGWAALSGERDVGEPGSTIAPPRVLVWTAGPLGVISDAGKATLDSLGERLTTCGAHMTVFPEEERIAELVEAHKVVMAYEAARERATELDVIDRLSEPLAKLLLTGAATSDGAYAAAIEAIADGREVIDRLLTSHDAIVGLATPTSAPPGLSTTGDPVLSRAWQALGLPALAIPGLRDRADLPLGLQAIGRRGDETGLLATGVWLERILRDERFIAQVAAYG